MLLKRDLPKPQEVKVNKVKVKVKVNKVKAKVNKAKVKVNKTKVKVLLMPLPKMRSLKLQLLNHGDPHKVEIDAAVF